ncbi:hypothetical protein A2U01_0101846, partial [Trifolium medium]|nr:hypothetical protein [Trifolium medium]
VLSSVRCAEGNCALRRLAVEGLEKPMVFARRAGGTGVLRQI